MSDENNTYEKNEYELAQEAYFKNKLENAFVRTKEEEEYLASLPPTIGPEN